MRTAMCLRLTPIVLFFFAASVRAGDPAPLSRTDVRLSLFGDTLPATHSGDLGGLPAGQEAPEGKKSVTLAAVYSMLLPGMGELYVGNLGFGKYFLIGEGAMWLTFTGFQVYGDALQSDARAFAVVHAGVNTSGKNDQFYVDVGNFASIDDYNAKKLRDRNPQLVYDPAKGYSWQWDSDAARVSFRDQRIKSENMINNEKFVVVAIVANHVASAVHAGLAALSHNKELGNTLGDVRLSAGLMGGMPNPHGVMLTLSKGI